MLYSARATSEQLEVLRAVSVDEMNMDFLFDMLNLPDGWKGELDQAVLRDAKPLPTGARLSLLATECATFEHTVEDIRAPLALMAHTELERIRTAARYDPKQPLLMPMSIVAQQIREKLRSIDQTDFHAYLSPEEAQTVISAAMDMIEILAGMLKFRINLPDFKVKLFTTTANHLDPPTSKRKQQRAEAHKRKLRRDGWSKSKGLDFHAIAQCLEEDLRKCGLLKTTNETPIAVRKIEFVKAQSKNWHQRVEPLLIRVMEMEHAKELAYSLERIQVAVGGLRGRIRVMQVSATDLASGVEDIPLKIESGRVTQIYNAETMHVGDHYQAQQAGAMGPGATAHHNTFQQVWNQVSKDIDAEQLKDELARLRGEMQARAKEVDDFVAIGKVAEAEKAAESGDGSKVVECLKGAGRWAKDVATQISAGAVVMLMQEAMKS